MELENLLKEFTYAFVRSFEERLKYLQKYLEDRPDKVESSKPGLILSTAISAIPQVGKPLSNAITQGDKYIQNRLEKDKACSMAEITYFSDNNKDTFRKILIEGAYDIFCRYEYQFSLISCNGGPLRAMQKLANDATYRVFSVLFEDKTVKNLTGEVVAKAILNGQSPRHGKKVSLSGRTLILENKNITTADFFANTGVRIEDDGVITYYRNESSIRILRHRLLFAWEDTMGVRSAYEVDRPEYSYKYEYIKRNKEEQIEIVRKFVVTKNPIEDLKEFVRNNNEELENLLKEVSNQIEHSQNETNLRNEENHHYTQELILNTEKSILNHLNMIILETLKQNLEEERREREEYERKREEEDAKRREKEDEERRIRDEIDRVRCEEEDRKREEERQIIQQIKTQQENAIMIDKKAIKEEVRKVGECLQNESKKLEEEGKRIVKKIKGIRIKW